MSISNLLSTNSYNLFANTLNAKELLADVLESSNLEVTGELIANKIVNSTGFNYLSPWASNKQYILNDLVISNNQLWRCLVANTNVVPDPNNPAQAEWVPLTSNNAILNERQYAQINGVNGDDAKALLSALPFKTVPAALAYLDSVGGGYAKIMTIGQGNVYGNATVLTLTDYDNIILDGGDQTDGFLDNPQNILNYNVIVNSTDNIVFKNLGWSALSSPFVLDSNNNKNVSLQNVTLYDGPDGIYNINIVGDLAGGGFGSHMFKDVWLNPNNNSVFEVFLSGYCPPNTRIVFENTGLLARSNISISNLQFGGLTNPENLTLVVKNCYVAVSNLRHNTGMNLIIDNCVIRGTIISNATAGSVIISNTSFYDPISNTWGGLALNGTAQYELIDCFTNPNSTIDNINIAGNVNSFNSTSGPAAKFNRLATWSGGAPTSTGAAQAVVQVLPGNIATNVFSMLTYNSGTGAITFVTPGVYQLTVSLSVQNTNTSNEQTVLHYWLGVSGSNEGSALAVSSTDRGFVGSAGILTAFPNSRRGIALFFNVINVATPYLFYVRSLSGAAYNVTIESMAILQLR